MGNKCPHQGLNLPKRHAEPIAKLTIAICARKLIGKVTCLTRPCKIVIPAGQLEAPDGMTAIQVSLLGVLCPL